MERNIERNEEIDKRKVQWPRVKGDRKERRQNKKKDNHVSEQTGKSD